MSAQPLKRDWFYWFVAIVTATQMPISALYLIDFILHPLEPHYQFQSVPYRLFSTLVIVPIIMFIALLVIRRAPHNLTGLCLLLWATIVIESTTRQLPSLPSYGWVGVWFLPLYFPDGRAFPRRFEPYIRLLCVGLVLSVFAWYFTTPASPIFLAAFEGLFPAAAIVEQAFLIAIVLMIFPSLIARYRASDQRVRQQMKWLGWVFFGIIATGIPMALTGLIATSDPLTPNPLQRLVFASWTVLIMLAPFFAVSIAILRHRLYDIDIIIRRTLIYSVLTSILAVIYFGGVVLAQQILRASTGETTDLAIVASTLLIAALFSPLRRRIQNTIDRRFYRRKYDAEQTIVRFNQTLRDEVDIDTLKAQLVGVVNDTMQPTKVALWLSEAKSDGL